MLGAIAGDVIGSVHEFGCGKTKDFPLFVADSRYTDDSVHTVAVADWLLTGKDLTDSLIERTRAICGVRRGRPSWSRVPRDAPRRLPAHRAALPRLCPGNRPAQCRSGKPSRRPGHHASREQSDVSPHA